MFKYLLLATFSFVLVGCIVIERNITHYPENFKLLEDDASDVNKENTGVKVEEKIVYVEKEPQVIVKKEVREVGCPRMVLPKLIPNPPLPKNEIRNAGLSDSAIDKIMIGYIAQLRKINETNLGLVHRTVSTNNAKCKK